MDEIPRYWMSDKHGPPCCSHLAPPAVPLQALDQVAQGQDNKRDPHHPARMP
jgi:hypothetical protein